MPLASSFASGAAGVRWLSSLSFKLKPVFQGNGSIPSNQALLAASLDASKGAALLLLLKKKLFCAFGQDSSRFLVFVNSLRIRSKRKELEIIRILPPSHQALTNSLYLLSELKPTTDRKRAYIRGHSNSTFGYIVQFHPLSYLVKRPQ